GLEPDVVYAQGLGVFNRNEAVSSVLKAAMVKVMVKVHIANQPDAFIAQLAEIGPACRESSHHEHFPMSPICSGQDCRNTGRAQAVHNSQDIYLGSAHECGSIMEI